MKEVFYQSETISYASGQAAGTLYKEVILDSAYERVVGIAVLESKDGGIPSYRIGIDDKDKQYISAVHKNLLMSDKAAGMTPSNRFMLMNIKAAGHKVKIATVIPAELTDALEYDIIFLLQREQQKQ